MDLGTDVVIGRREAGRVQAGGRLQAGGCAIPAGSIAEQGAHCTSLFLAGFATFGALGCPRHLVPGVGTLQREEGAGKRGGLASCALTPPPVPRNCSHLFF